ncbi:phosphoribosyltransferase family protein [Adhaeribacter radiodurans]|uniref:Phosphoribosyltransferase n=1 Tax=Adhaeribacter radiodurans TaxID=2745197 RepID=A0A7L7L340_9BACT|nr:phosphoribosyltransferase family protein [Adhaeribacter radiodurans]QMU27183.1 phosphoribosyltransferase [Adhaeribacter radiodurans]
MSFSPSSRILTRQEIMQKIKRMAFEIYEKNFEESSLYLAGIHENGYKLAELLAAELGRISPLTIQLLGITLDKIHPLSQPIVLDPANPHLEGQVVILVDDVLNSGKTMAYSFQLFLKTEVKKVETATLINRNNTLYPITVTYTGLSLATTLLEHIRVVLTDDESYGAYLI